MSKVFEGGTAWIKCGAGWARSGARQNGLEQCIWGGTCWNKVYEVRPGEN